MSLIAAFSAIVAAVPAGVLAVYTIEVLGGLWPASTSPATPAAPVRTTVLIPAHNEAGLIGATVSALARQCGPMTSILVVADNCTDATAALARAQGAQVVERHDLSRRGKGYALACGRDALAALPPDCVVVLDADCVIEGAGVEALSALAVASGRAVQSRNLQRPVAGGAPSAQISGFAFLVKNLVRQRGMMRLGGVAGLGGTGMAFPWSVFADAPLATDELAEDLAFGVWLTHTNRPPMFVEAVHTWSDPASGQDLMVQRNRWERGFLRTARRHAIPLVLSGIVRFSRSRVWLGLHLLVPPLALLFALSGALLMIVGILAALGGGMAPPAALACAIVAAAGATALAWAREGRAQVSGAALLRAPAYIMMKLPLYRTMLGRGEAGWVRTRRSGEDKPRL